MSEYQDELKHYGILRKSGRYEWGSGKDEYQRSTNFYGMIDKLKKDNPDITEVEIAAGMGLSVADLRSTKTIAKEEIIRDETRQIVKLRDKGTSPKAIAEQLGMKEPTVRLRLKNSENMKESSLRAAADAIRREVDKHEIVDVGKGVEHQLQIADTRKKAAIALLRDEGYETYNLQVKQPGSVNFTNQSVIVPPGTGFGNAKRMTDRIHTMGEWSEDGGQKFLGIQPPLSVSSKRLAVQYKEDGGADSDGLIRVRPGVPDLDMGKNIYAQVRIAIDGSHYLKGMAVLDPNLPAGVDMVFSTNKSKNDPKVKAEGDLGALKPLKRTKDGDVDPDMPFGSIIKRQILETGKDGAEKVKSAINIVNETGDWDDWRKSLPSQMLAKQPHPLIKSQLKETRDNVRKRLDEIDQITNAVVRRKALEDFADQIDSDGVELRAAAMPHQSTKVLIPMPKMNKKEIYAPSFPTGEKVVLIRYPHGGRFEIPEVTVNNNNRTAKKLLGDARDAIGIHPEVAERLSGADFDGDTVIVIPNSAGRIKGSLSMGSQAKVYEDGLKNFDPKREYGGYEVIGTRINKKGEIEDVGNFKLMKTTGLDMGGVTNLITDMSIQGAKPEHVVQAVRHSMVVIDAEKHKLDYQRSARENNIAHLKTLYQGSPKSGAATLLSRATSEVRVPDRKLRTAKKGGPIDPDTGARVYEETGKTRSKYDPTTQKYLDEKVPVESSVRRLDLTDDAYTLVRDRADPVERLYADHVNEMKALANATRLRAVRTPMPKINPQARVVYRDEVAKLNADLKAAQAQKPLDRKANVIANAAIKAKRMDDPTLRLDRDRMRKVERAQQAAVRARMNLTKPTIEITDRQWDAIQAGAVSSSRLREILGYADAKRVSELSMPRKNTVVTSAVGARAKAMLAAGATMGDVASALGVSVSTLRAAAIRGDL